MEVEELLFLPVVKLITKRLWELPGAGLGQAVNKVLGNADYKKAAEQWKNKEKAKFNNLDSVITLVEKI